MINREYIAVLPIWVHFSNIKMNLHSLFQVMAATKTEADLRFRLMDSFADIFGVQR